MRIRFSVWLNRPTTKARLRLALTVVLSAALVLGVVFVLNIAQQKPAVDQAVPVKAGVQSINGATQILAANGLTQSITSTGQAIGSYLADCYEHLEITGTQAVSVSIQHGADGVNWLNLYSFTPFTNASAALVITDAFTQTPFYGQKTRAIAILSSTAPITVALNCVFH